MALNFIITVDTEADNQWAKDSSLSVNNLKFIPRFQNLCEKFGFVPTYLLTYEAATDPGFTSWLKGKVVQGLAEAGAHLHPWSTPPFDLPQDQQQKTFPSALDYKKLQDKLLTLTETIKNNLGVKPIVFRAGRWGISTEVIKVLGELGYLVDSSVTPFLNWQKLIDQAPESMNFSSAPFKAYSWGKLTEIPMTIVPVPRWRVRLGPLGNKLFYRKIWGRIFPTTEVKDLILAFKEAKKLGMPNFQLMTHSSELMVGGSIYNRTEEDLENFYQKLEGLFSFLKEQQVTPLPLSAAAKKTTEKEG